MAKNEFFFIRHSNSRCDLANNKMAHKVNVLKYAAVTAVNAYWTTLYDFYIPKKNGGYWYIHEPFDEDWKEEKIEADKMIDEAKYFALMAIYEYRRACTLAGVAPESFNI